MRDWLKFFFLGFFNKELAIQSKKRSVWNGILSFFVAFILLYLALAIAFSVSFPTHYSNSSEFIEFWHGIFDDCGVRFEIQNRKASAYYDNGDIVRVNTFASQSDKEKYSKNGYDLIIDVRDGASLYSDFDFVFVNADNDSTLTYDEYDKLSDSSKKDYSIKITLSEEAIEFTPELIDEYTAFIKNRGGVDSLATLEQIGNGIVAADDYGKVYELYFDVKFGELSTGYASAPTIRDYYISTYLATDSDGNSIYDNYVILLHDLVFASFYDDSEVRLTVTGYYDDAYVKIDGNLLDADNLMLGLYKTNKGVIMINCFLYLLRGASVVGLIWLVLPLICAILHKICKGKKIPGYGETFKAMGSFWLWSAVPAVIYAIIASFVTSQVLVLYVSFIMVLIVDVIRMLIHFIGMKNLDDSEDANDSQEEETIDNTETNCNCSCNIKNN